MLVRRIRRAAGGVVGLAVVLGACRAERTGAAAPPPDSAATRTAAAVDTALPAGVLGASIRRGHALLTATRDSLPMNVRSSLRCMSCHLDDGRRPHGLMLVGVYSRFPQYRSRSARVELIEDRVNDCFERSLNGRAIDRGGQDMRDIVSYLAWISRGVAPGDSLPGQGLAKLPVLAGDATRGASTFAATCARCHGPDGAGTALAPPLWGPHSFNIGAGMARGRTLAAFVRMNMPRDRPGTLTDQEAFDLAAWISSRPRPDFPGKEKDWPHGDPPPDVPYVTTAARRAAADSPQHAPKRAGGTNHE